jgi:hypothetical protein
MRLGPTAILILAFLAMRSTDIFSENYAFDKIKSDFLEKAAGFKKIDVSLFETALSASGKSNELSIHGSDDASADLDYVPNYPIPVAFSLGYNGLTFLGSYGEGDQSNDYAIESQCYAFQGFYYTGYLGLDVYYEKYSGFYLDGLPYDPGNAYPNLELTTKTLNLYVKLKGEASLRELKDPRKTEKPFDFQYATFIMPYVSMHSIKSPSLLLPASYSTIYPALTNLTYMNLGSVGCAWGIVTPIYAWRFYLIPAFSLGFGYPFFDTDAELKSAYDIKVNLKVRLGYYSKHMEIEMAVGNDSDAITSLDSDEMVQFHSLNIDFGIKARL